MLEDLERQLLAEKAHSAAVQQCLDETNRKYVQVVSQLNYVKETAAKHLTSAAGIIEGLHDRLDVMCDAWEAEILSRKDISDEERKELLQNVAPFRPVRISVGTVESAGQGDRH